MIRVPWRLFSGCFRQPRNCCRTLVCSRRMQTLQEPPKKGSTLLSKLFKFGIFSSVILVAYSQYVKKEYLQLKHRRNEDHAKYPPQSLVLNNWQILALQKFPTRFLSSMWGKLHEIELPVFLRKPFLGFYVYLFNCNLDEASKSDLSEYKNLNDFFTRKLIPNARPIDEAIITSPADGRVLHFGPVVDNRIEAVKGITYDATQFLGVELPVPRLGYKIEHITIYLSPGDYHRYHSPTNWTILNRRHFPGELWSVAPSVVRIIDGLFNYNERAVLTGNWINGFFSFTAVGAYNVGSINFNFDKDLVTNQPIIERDLESLVYRKSFDRLTIVKGDELGMFKLGSTVVLVFEVPESFEFSVKPNDYVKVGQSLV